MNAEIAYTHIVDQSEKTSTFSGTEAEALAAGIDRLIATETEDGDYIYFARVLRRRRTLQAKVN